MDNNWWKPSDAFLGCSEGHGSELSRRMTAMVLFSRDGRPGAWLMVIGALWGIVAATVFGTPT